MFIKEVFIMYNSDITSIIKCHYVPEDKLQNAEICFLDLSETISIKEDSSTISTISPRVYTKSLSTETIKRGFVSNTNRIFEEIIDRYYEMYLECRLQNKMRDNDMVTHKYDIKDDIKNLYYACHNANRFISKESRFGPSNVIIVPDKNYEQIIKSSISNNIIINPTKLHKDKIFLIRVDNELTTPGLSLFISKNIITKRYIKLMKIMKRMGKHIDDLSFSYILANVGYHPEKFVQCIYLVDN